MVDNVLWVKSLDSNEHKKNSFSFLSGAKPCFDVYGLFLTFLDEHGAIFLCFLKDSIQLEN